MEENNVIKEQHTMQETLDHRLTERNIKPTAVRLLVLKAFMAQEAAIGLADLENRFDHADKTTLYRTLKTFEEHKLIHSIDDGTGALKYALCEETCDCAPEDLHVHFLCTVCNKTFCLNDTPIPQINLPTDFSLDSVNMVVKGLCSDCR
ncbi:Fur family transcriptional regulator [Prolixibacter sp. NT017]|uniref:Fur family transcriptional regulator n=1 Tax=Prolixibacter sp. NT017 TaxID=2652390 RepID=UPI001E619193|nr:transcriptional repressor [Prolixibacter sp. NT017]